MTTTAYLTKNVAGNVELWKTKPYYDKDVDEWFSRIPGEVGSEIFDDLLTKFVGEKECIKIIITKKKERTKYENSNNSFNSPGNAIIMHDCE